MGARPVLKTLALGVTALLCVACSSVSPATRYYLLNPVIEAQAPAPAAHTPGKRIGISLLRLPQYLDRASIVTRSSNNELKLAAYDRWGGNPEKNIRQVMKTNLAQLLASAGFSMIAAGSELSPELDVEIELSRFERFPDGVVRLSAVWSVLDHSGTLLTGRSSDLSSPAIAGAEDYDAIVAAMSDLLGQLSRDIARAILHPDAA